MATWRLIPPLCASGAFQMALDAWLFEQHRQGHHPPTLRFYTWEPAAISLGYHQKDFPEHWKSLAWEGQALDVVRRPTGGRAVLHQGDLTYAVITSELPMQRKAAYQRICEFLIRGWRSLGIDLAYGTAGRGYIHNPNCFGTATAADLVTADGSKLIGSAQLWRGDTVLQHGSMQLQPNLDLFQTVFGIALNPPKLPDLLKQSHELIVASLVEAAKTCFNTDFDPQPISPEEHLAVVRRMKL